MGSGGGPNLCVKIRASVKKCGVCVVKINGLDSKGADLVSILINLYAELSKTYLHVAASLVNLDRQKKESVISGRKP